MPVWVRLAITVLIGLMVAVEVAEDHAVHIVIMGFGLLAWAIYGRISDDRRRLSLVFAATTLVAVCVSGITYWFDGNVDWRDALYAVGASLVGLGVAAAVWGLFLPAAGGRNKS